MSTGLRRPRQILRKTGRLGILGSLRSLGSELWGVLRLVGMRTTVSRLRSPLGSLSIISEALGILLPD